MIAIRRGWVILAGAAVGMIAVACAAPPATSSKLCAKASECADDETTTPDAPKSSLDTPVLTEDEIKTPDGGSKKTEGPLCAELAKCCAKISSSGSDSTTCEAAVGRRDEAACKKANDGYSTYGPCVPETPPPRPVTGPGPQCTALAACCKTIETSGSDPSVCEGAAAKKQETSCKSALDGYKAFGPCS